MADKTFRILLIGIIFCACGKASKKNFPMPSQQQPGPQQENSESKSPSFSQGSQNPQPTQAGVTIELPKAGVPTGLPNSDSPPSDLTNIPKLYTLSGNIGTESNATACADASRSLASMVSQAITLTVESDPKQRRYIWCNPPLGKMEYQALSKSLYGENGWADHKVLSLAWFTLMSDDGNNANFVKLFFLEGSSTLTPYIDYGSIANSQVQIGGGGYFGGMPMLAPVGTEIKFSDSFMTLGKLYMKKTATGGSLRLEPSNGEPTNIPLVILP